MKRSREIHRFRKSITHHFLLRTLHVLEGGSNYFLFSSLMVFAVYLLGNFQSFLEGTQIRILFFVQILSIIALVVTLYYVIFLVIWMIKRRKFLLSRVMYGLLALGVNATLAVGSLLIQDLSRGFQ